MNINYKNKSMAARISDRVRRLRDQSTGTTPYISTERAELITEFYKSKDAGSLSTPVSRALVFKYILENKKVYIGEGELIVGERGPAPRATPTYPELCCHTLDDLDILSSRERTRFDVDERTREIYRSNIIPFWSGRSMRQA